MSRAPETGLSALDVLRAASRRHLSGAPKIPPWRSSTTRTYRARIYGGAAATQLCRRHGRAIAIPPASSRQHAVVQAAPASSRFDRHGVEETEAKNRPCCGGRAGREGFEHVVDDRQLRQFTYNLVQYFGELGRRARLPQRPDHARRIAELGPTSWCCRRLLAGRGGICVRRAAFRRQAAILGVCLGPRASAPPGRRIVRAHGRCTARRAEISTDGAASSTACGADDVIRYHSLHRRASLPPSSK